MIAAIWGTGLVIVPLLLAGVIALGFALWPGVARDHELDELRRERVDRVLEALVGWPARELDR